MENVVQEVESCNGTSHNIRNGCFNIVSRSVKEQIKGSDWMIPLVLRLVVTFAMVATTMLMAFDKQTKTLVVATIGNTPIELTIVTKFQHMKAYVFLVVANAVGSVYTIVVCLIEIFGNKSNFKQLRRVIIPILDMIVLALASMASGAAIFVGEISEHGNSHARWNKFCDKFNTYCDIGLAGCITSLIGVSFLIILNSVALINQPNTTLYRHNNSEYHL